MPIVSEISYQLKNLLRIMKHQEKVKKFGKSFPAEAMCF